MKFTTIAIIATAALSSTVQSFTVLPNAVQIATPSVSRMGMFFAEETDAKEGNDFGSKMPTVYDRLGFTDEQIAIGVKPSEVLQWLGNRDDLIAKFTSDNKGMESEKVESEVDKFMMDREMVEAFIAYEKRKADPRNLREEAESNLSDPSTWGVYAVWITGGAGFAYVKNVIIEPKYASGEWEEIHISLPKFGQAAVDAASTSVDAVSSAADTAATVVDAASSAM